MTFSFQLPEDELRIQRVKNFGSTNAKYQKVSKEK